MLYFHLEPSVDTSIGIDECIQSANNSRSMPDDDLEGDDFFNMSVPPLPSPLPNASPVNLPVNQSSMSQILPSNLSQTSKNQPYSSLPSINVPFSMSHSSLLPPTSLLSPTAHVSQYPSELPLSFEHLPPAPSLLVPSSMNQAKHNTLPSISQHSVTPQSSYANQSISPLNIPPQRQNVYMNAATSNCSYLGDQYGDTPSPQWPGSYQSRMSTPSENVCNNQ